MECNDLRPIWKGSTDPAYLEEGWALRALREPEASPHTTLGISDQCPSSDRIRYVSVPSGYLKLIPRELAKEMVNEWNVNDASPDTIAGYTNVV